MSKNQYRICQCDQFTSLHVPCYMSASLKWKLKVYSNELFLFQLTNDLCRSFTKIIIILFVSKALSSFFYKKRTLLFQYFVLKIEPP